MRHGKGVRQFLEGGCRLEFVCWGRRTGDGGCEVRGTVSCLQQLHCAFNYTVSPGRRSSLQGFGLGKLRCVI